MKTPLTWPVCLLIIAVFWAVRLNHQARTVTGKTDNNYLISKNQHNEHR